MINKVNVDFKTNEQILENIKDQMVAVCEGKNHLKHIETIFEYEQKENIHHYFCNAIYMNQVVMNMIMGFIICCPLMQIMGL